MPVDDVRTAYYLRLLVADQAGVLADVTRILGDLDISIEAILQQEAKAGESDVPVVILTHNVIERAMRHALTAIETLPAIRGPVIRIRMESLL